MSVEHRRLLAAPLRHGDLHLTGRAEMMASDASSSPPLLIGGDFGLGSMAGHAMPLPASNAGQLDKRDPLLVIE